MRRKQHKWQQEVKNGKRRIFIGESRELGLRISHKTGAIENPDSMSHMITSNLMEKSMTVVVGSRHKSFIPNLRKDGIVFGKGKRVNAVSKKTHAILHKMNFGGSLEDQLEDYGRNPENSIFKNPRYVGYDFMNEGYNNAKSSI